MKFGLICSIVLLEVVSMHVEAGCFKNPLSMCFGEGNNGEKPQPHPSEYEKVYEKFFGKTAKFRGMQNTLDSLNLLAKLSTGDVSDNINALIDANRKSAKNCSPEAVIRLGHLYIIHKRSPSLEAYLLELCKQQFSLCKFKFATVLEDTVARLDPESKRRLELLADVFNVTEITDKVRLEVTLDQKVIGTGIVTFYERSFPDEYKALLERRNLENVVWNMILEVQDSLKRLLRQVRPTSVYRYPASFIGLEEPGDLALKLLPQLSLVSELNVMLTTWRFRVNGDIETELAARRRVNNNKAVVN